MDDRLSTVEDALVNLEIAIDDLSNVDIALEQRIAELEATVSGKMLNHVWYLTFYHKKTITVESTG